MATGRIWIGWSVWAPKTELKIRARPEERFGSKIIPETKIRGYRNPIGYSKPALYGNIVREISTSYKHIQDMYNIYMYKQKEINSK